MANIMTVGVSSMNGRTNLTDDVVLYDLDKRLLASAKKVLLQRIDFKEATMPDEQDQQIRSKYKSINPLYDPKKLPSNVNQSPLSSPKEGGRHLLASKDGIPIPRIILFPLEKVETRWKEVRRIGPGLVNLGNTCFLNSVLQVLTYTAPLVNFLISDIHGPNSCVAVGFCMLCEMRTHVLRSTRHNPQSGPIRPMSVIQKLSYIGKHLRFGRQEDAHEFLRYVIEGLQKGCLVGKAKLDRLSKETTAINQIFGGFYRNQVTCLSCKTVSNTYDPIMEINLDIKESNTLNAALKRSVRTEVLDGENKYQCDRCRTKHPAQRKGTIHRAPNVLTIQLKRFDFHRTFGGKVSKDVHFTEEIDLRPFMSNNLGHPIRYQLYAVLVHSGYSCNSGHYYCYAKAPNGTWYEMNDSKVSQVGINTVLKAQAYLLFYVRLTKHKPENGKAMNGLGSSTMTMSQMKAQLPKTPNPKTPIPKTPTGNASPNDVGVHIQRKEPKIIPLNTDRTKIKFTFDKSKGSSRTPSTPTTPLTPKTTLSRTPSTPSTPLTPKTTLSKTPSTPSTPLTPKTTLSRTPSTPSTPLTPKTPSTPGLACSERQPLTVKLKVPSKLEAKRPIDSSSSSSPESRKQPRLTSLTSLDQIKTDYDSNESEASSEGGEKRGDRQKKDNKCTKQDSFVESRQNLSDLISLDIKRCSQSEGKGLKLEEENTVKLEEEKENLLKPPLVNEAPACKEACDEGGFSTPKAVDVEHLRKSKLKKSMLSPPVGFKFRTMTPMKSGFTPRAVYQRSYSDTDAFAFAKVRKSDIHNHNRGLDNPQSNTPHGIHRSATKCGPSPSWHVFERQHSEVLFGPMTPPPKGTDARQRTSSITSEASSIASVVSKTGEWDIYEKDLPTTPTPLKIRARQFAGWSIDREKNDYEKSKMNQPKESNLTRESHTADVNRKESKESNTPDVNRKESKEERTSISYDNSTSKHRKSKHVDREDSSKHDYDNKKNKTDDNESVWQKHVDYDGDRQKYLDYDGDRQKHHDNDGDNCKSQGKDVDKNYDTQGSERKRKYSEVEQSTERKHKDRKRKKKKKDKKKRKRERSDIESDDSDIHKKDVHNHHRRDSHILTNSYPNSSADVSDEYYSDNKNSRSSVDRKRKDGPSECNTDSNKRSKLSFPCFSGSQNREEEKKESYFRVKSSDENKIVLKKDRSNKKKHKHHKKRKESSDSEDSKEPVDRHENQPANQSANQSANEPVNEEKPSLEHEDTSSRKKGNHVKHWDDTSKSSTTWDGSENTEALDYLLSKGSSKGYGGTIKSWTGEDSTVDQSRDVDEKKSQTDSWDDDYDQGKVKKTKKHKEFSPPKKWKHENQFQKVANRKNEKVREHLSKSSWF